MMQEWADFLEQTQRRRRLCCPSVEPPGARGLDFETSESIDIDEITPYSSCDPLLVFTHF